MVLKKILCFGDSNTWGFSPATWERYPQDIRWPGILQNELGESYRVIEEGLNGRSAVGGSPLDTFGDSKTDLASILASRCPLDLVILMLGTNDLLMGLSVTPSDVGKAIEILLGLVYHSGAGPGGSAPAVLLLAPPPIGARAGERELHEGAVARSHLLAERYASIAVNFGCAFLDTGEFIRSSDIDGCHLDASEHKKLGAIVAKHIHVIFAGVG